MFSGNDVLDSSTCHRRGRKRRRVHGDPGGIFIATREPSNGTQRCSGREPLVAMMEPADLWKRHDLSDAAGLNRSPLGGVLAQRRHCHINFAAGNLGGKDL